MQHLFFRWPLEPFHMASPCKPTQLREFLGVAFKAKFTTLPAGKSKKEEESGTQKIGITLSYPVPHELLTAELLCVFTPSSSLFTTGKSQ